MYYDSTTKQVVETKHHNLRGLELAYNNRFGNFLMEVIFKRKFFTTITSKYYYLKSSTSLIAELCHNYEIDVNEFIDPVESFQTFNEFFIRKLKPSARPFTTEVNQLSSPADGYLSVIDVHVEQFSIKGIKYNLQQFLQDQKLTTKYANSTIVVVRLTLSDYHHFAYVTDSVLKRQYQIDGFFHTVNYNYHPAYLKTNKRQVTEYSSTEFGDYLQIEVGAMGVGKIVNHPEAAVKGNLKGYFEFGGSTVCLMFEKPIEIEQEFHEHLVNGLEIKVKMGQKIAQIKE